MRLFFLNRHGRQLSSGWLASSKTVLGTQPLNQQLNNDNKRNEANTARKFPRNGSVRSGTVPGTVLTTHLEAGAEGVPARVLPEHERRVLVEADQLSVHDLVRLLVLQDTILVVAVNKRYGDQKAEMNSSVLQ